MHRDAWMRGVLGYWVQWMRGSANGLATERVRTEQLGTIVLLWIRLVDCKLQNEHCKFAIADRCNHVGPKTLCNLH
ncbi:hypothetical protein RB12932 [Rhodopirellula baltica SH 1]|uniref:Uncharacterized protein n=1 Tax=Rhodopirellula baltica (strain DSM 10527 / NCIMB 13988 / SH1) TaxID=243090 RepID=Q7UHV9_RHOBA|nr:hypothetical protein RB12932 [Rhodopirellula baltica SH 1]